MSYTFYVDDWNKQQTKEVKSYFSDIYSSFTQEDIEEIVVPDYPDAIKDNKGWYRMEKAYINPFPELHVAHGHLTPILATIDMEFDYCGAIEHKFLSDIIHSIIKAINLHGKSEANAIETEVSGNLISYGISGERIREKLSELLVVLKFANENGKGVYWG